MGLFDFIFLGRNPNIKEDARLLKESIDVPLNSPFNLGTFLDAAASNYIKPSTKKMAKAAAEVAKLIDTNFDTNQVSCMVPATEISSSADHRALPIHFLFTQNGCPKVAVVIVTEGGYKLPQVEATRKLCNEHNIAYLRVFATGGYADWIEGKDRKGKPIAPQVASMCKKRIVERIKKHLN